ncbi:MAG TPA: hypothetical protein VGQ19_18660, partial [Burkholderiales bacterium]|nr:hypothetical protein [Burkholderiales bacterium]
MTLGDPAGGQVRLQIREVASHMRTVDPHALSIGGEKGDAGGLLEPSQFGKAVAQRIVSLIDAAFTPQQAGKLFTAFATKFRQQKIAKKGAGLARPQRHIATFGIAEVDPAKQVRRQHPHPHPWATNSNSVSLQPLYFQSLGSTAWATEPRISGVTGTGMILFSLHGELISRLPTDGQASCHPSSAADEEALQDLARLGFLRRVDDGP